MKSGGSGWRFDLVTMYSFDVPAYLATTTRDGIKSVTNDALILLLVLILDCTSPRRRNNARENCWPVKTD